MSQPLAFLPALLFAASNSLAEELAYRGAMRTWLAPSLGVTGANLAQAVVFGLAHTGEDFVGIEAVIPTMLAMIVVGFVGRDRRPPDRLVDAAAGDPCRRGHPDLLLLGLPARLTSRWTWTERGSPAPEGPAIRVAWDCCGGQAGTVSQLV